MATGMMMLGHDVAVGIGRFGLHSLERLPGVATLIQHRRQARFLSAEGFASHYGVYASFAEALASMPPSAHPDQRDVIAEHIRVRLHRVFDHDLPMIHWLGSAFATGATSIYDIGGSVGVHYYAYSRRLEYPSGLDWLVCEVPPVAQMGRELQADRRPRGLRFVDTLAPETVAADIWMSSGAIHYIEQEPAALLARCPRRPRHLLLNKLPLHEGDDFVSLQNCGENCFVPHRVYNRNRFIADVVAAGFRLADSWPVAGRSFHLPGHPEKSFGQYSGLCFTASR